MRASAPRCDRLQARRRTALLPTISTFAIDLRAPFAARLDARALRRSCARTLKLWPARARSTDRWRGVRARAVQVRRRRRRRSALRGATGAECGASACGLTPTEAAAAAAAAAMEATTCARHRRHATVSSASLRSPRGRRAIGRVGARRFDAAGVSNAAPTGTVAKGSVGALQGDVGDGIRAEPGEATMARLSPRAAPRHLVSMRRAPCHRRLPAWCVCVTHRGCLAPMPARLRRAPQELARLRGEASVGGVRGFHRVRVLVFV
jgi:hypothetical protein